MRLPFLKHTQKWGRSNNTRDTLGGGSQKCHQMSHESRGGLKSAQKCHVIFEWTLNACT